MSAGVETEKMACRRVGRNISLLRGTWQICVFTKRPTKCYHGVSKKRMVTSSKHWNYVGQLGTGGKKKGC